jgi:hypothetical protein
MASCRVPVQMKFEDVNNLYNTYEGRDDPAMTRPGSQAREATLHASSVQKLHVRCLVGCSRRGYSCGGGMAFTAAV